MKYEYKTAFANTPELLDMLVNEFMAQGWELWGNPYVLVYPSSDVRIYHQVVVLPKNVMVVKDATFEASEPAGFTVLVPEQPEVETGVNGSTIHSAWPLMDGRLCACFEKEGDNLECPMHYGQPVSGMVS
ncbi:MAG: hypothetical protein ABSG01_09105 [Anaerolineales bacterium]|jgi:hypothetical protein